MMTHILDALIQAMGVVEDFHREEDLADKIEALLAEAMEPGSLSATGRQLIIDIDALSEEIREVALETSLLARDMRDREVRMATLMALYELLIVQRLCPDDLAQSVHRRRSAGWFLWSVHYQLAGGLGYWRSDFEAFVDLLYAWLPYCTYAQAQDGLNRQSEDALRRFLSEDPNLSQQEVSDACDIATLKLYRDLWEQPAVWREVVGFLESQRRTDGE